MPTSMGGVKEMAKKIKVRILEVEEDEIIDADDNGNLIIRKRNKGEEK